MATFDFLDAASLFIDTVFPNCQGALLAGSLVRGEETVTSDLDIVVFDQSISSSYRESFVKNGWPIEVFVHNLTSYKHFFKEDCLRGRPSLPRMVSEGIILKDEGILETIKLEALEILNKGPELWTEEIIYIKRYFLTDVLDDFIGSSNNSETIFIANHLGELISEFYLRVNGQWIGTSKWLVRALKSYDEKFTSVFINAFDTFYKTGNKSLIIELVDDVLLPYGGRLFEGFTLGK